MPVYPVPKVKRVKDEKYLKRIREFRCCACKRWPVDAHHVKTKGAGGGDHQTVPLCRACHSLLDSPGMSRSLFEKKYRINFDKEVKWYQWIINHEHIPHCG